ncbi:histidine phosphatase family protein [Pseudoclavibacter soli]|uniref:histidine phosphatase family protein n=1 Tax=Pseudoclavibacter soli TaxID=452623 RepID=UPI0003FF53D6|nr:histidine phosphatase family protein [Pseudoclavibacter soli]
MHTTIGLIRHGETDWNAQRRIQGRTDIPLNDRGRAQARVAAERLMNTDWQRIYTSPLQRAADTASIVAEVLGLPAPGVLDDVAERSFGEIEGLTYAERTARFAEDTAVPGLETRADVVARSLPALSLLAAAHPGQNLLVVTHGGVIGSLIRHVTDFRLPNPADTIPNGSTNVFTVDEVGAWALQQYEGAPGDAAARPIP